MPDDSKTNETTTPPITPDPPAELTIPQLRDHVLSSGVERGLLLIGVELVDCARGIEVALDASCRRAATCRESIGGMSDAFVRLGSAARAAGQSFGSSRLALAEYQLAETPKWRWLAKWLRARKLARLRAANESAEVS